MDTKQIIPPFETPRASSPIMKPQNNSQHFSAKESDTSAPLETVPKSYSISLPHSITEDVSAPSNTVPLNSSEITEESKYTTSNTASAASPNLHFSPSLESSAKATFTEAALQTSVSDYPESPKETSRSAESPSPQEKEKMQKQESFSEIEKDSNLETVLVSEKTVVGSHQDEKEEGEKGEEKVLKKTTSTLPLEMQLEPIELPVPAVEEHTKDNLNASLFFKDQEELKTNSSLPYSQLSDQHADAPLTVGETMEATSFEAPHASQPGERTPVRRSSLKKAHGGSAKRPVPFVREANISAGSLVFGQVKGFPKWPAMVLEPTDIPEMHLPKKLGMNMYCVMFYGTYEYGFLRERDVIPFAPNLEAVLLLAGTKKQQQAIKEAQTHPNIIYEKNKLYLENQKIIDTANELQEEEEEEGREEGDEEGAGDDEETQEATPKRHHRRGHATTPSSSSKAKDTDSKRGMSKQSSSSPSTTPSQKKRRASASVAEDTTPTSKRMKHRSNVSNPPETSSSSTSASLSRHRSAAGAVYTKPSSSSALASRANFSKHSDNPTYLSLMKLRHTLQRTFIQDKYCDKRPRANAETLHTLEWHIINGALDELGRYLRHADFDAELFKATKLPKVLHMVSTNEYEPVVQEKMNEHRIFDRVNELLHTIKVLMAPPPPAPQTPLEPSQQESEVVVSPA